MTPPLNDLALKVERLNEPLTRRLQAPLSDLASRQTTLLSQYRNALAAVRAKPHSQQESDAIDQEIASSVSVDRIGSETPGLPADAVSVRSVCDQAWQKLLADATTIIGPIRDAHVKALVAMERSARSNNDAGHLGAVLAAQKAIPGLLPASMQRRLNRQCIFTLRTGFEDFPDELLLDGAPTMGYSGKWCQRSYRVGPPDPNAPLMEIATTEGNSFARIVAERQASSTLAWDLKRLPADVIVRMKKIRWGLDVRVQSFRSGPTEADARKIASKNPGKAVTGVPGTPGLLVYVTNLTAAPARLMPEDGLLIELAKMKKREWTTHASDWMNIAPGADIYSLSAALHGFGEVDIDNVFIEIK